MISEQSSIKGTSLYLPEGDGPFPLICQTPLLGRLHFLEDLFFEKKIAAYFAENGFACVILDRPIFEYNPKLDLEQLAVHIEESIQRNENSLGEILKNPKIDSDRVGTFGMSFGAVINSLWAARDRRLKVHVFALAGADIAEIFMTSRDPLMTSYREAAVRHSGLHGTELRNKLRTIFCEDGAFKTPRAGKIHENTVKQDPLYFSGEISKKSILIILALFDRVIHFNLGIKFKELLGNPQTIYLPLGHYTSILAIPFLRFAAVRFFKKRLLPIPCMS